MALCPQALKQRRKIQNFTMNLLVLGPAQFAISSRKPPSPPQHAHTHTPWAEILSFPHQHDSRSRACMADSDRLNAQKAFRFIQITVSSECKTGRNTCCTILRPFSSINLAAGLVPHHEASAWGRPQLRGRVWALCNVGMAGVLKAAWLTSPSTSDCSPNQPQMGLFPRARPGLSITACPSSGSCSFSECTPSR